MRVSPAVASIEVPHSKPSKMPMPLNKSKAEISVFPMLKPSFLSKSTVAPNSPKLCRAATPKATTATNRNHARLFMKPETSRKIPQAPATLVKGRIRSRVGVWYS